MRNKQKVTKLKWSSLYQSLSSSRSKNFGEVRKAMAGRNSQVVSNYTKIRRPTTNGTSI